VPGNGAFGVIDARPDGQDEEVQVRVDMKLLATSYTTLIIID
jgi:hypothetical protein